MMKPDIWNVSTFFEGGRRSFILMWIVIGAFGGLIGSESSVSVETEEEAPFM